MKNKLKFLTILVAVFLIALFFLYPPYWSHMEDSSNLLRMQEGWSSGHLWEKIFALVRTDLTSYGTFRPLNVISIFTYYKAFGSDPVLAYGILGILILLLCWAWANAFEKLTNDRHNKESFYLYLLFCFVFTPHLQLFIYLPIQEKFIAACSLLAILGLTRYLESGKGALLMMAGSLLSYLSKPTGLFVCLLLAALLFLDYLQTQKRRSLLFSGLFLLTAAAMGAFAVVMRGQYSGRYHPLDLASYLPQLTKKTLVYFAFSIFTLGLSIGKNFKKGTPLTASLCLSEVVWPMGFLIYLFLLLPWQGGTTGYFLTGASFFFIGTMTLFFQLVLGTNFGRRFQVPFVLCLGLLILNRAFPAYRLFLARAAEKDVVEWIQSQNNPDKEKRPQLFIPTPCEEAAISFPRFAQYPDELIRTYPDSIPFQNQREAYLITSGECPPEGFNAFDLENPLLSKGYTQIFRKKN
jgi:hypothetical protein